MKKHYVWFVALLILMALVGCQDIDKPLSIWVTDDELWTFVGEKVTLNPVIEFQDEGLVYDYPFIFTSSNYQVIRFLETEKNVFEVLSFSDTPIIITIYDQTQTISKTITVNVVRQIQGIRNVSFGTDDSILMIGQSYDMLIDVIGLSEHVTTVSEDILERFTMDVFAYNSSTLSLEPLHDILTFENDKVYAVGYAKGIIRFSVKDKPDIFYDVDFETSFATPDVYLAVGRQVDTSTGFITGNRLSSIEELTINDPFANLSHYMVSPHIKRLTVGYLGSVASLTGINDLSNVILLVPPVLYDAYLKDARYQVIKDNIYPNLGHSLSEVVYELKHTFTEEKEFIVLSMGIEKQMNETKSQLGFTFLGWKTVGQQPFITTHTVSGYMKLYTVWQINTYRITFDTMGGQGVTHQDYEYNQTLTLPIEAPDIYKETHVFKGWYIDSQYQTPFTLSKMPAESITLYAKWGLLVKLTFVTQGGPSIEPIEKEAGTPLVMPNYGTYSGHVFGGWFLDPEYSTPFNSSVIPSSDRVIYVKWDKTYMITFHDAGNKTTMQVIYDKVIDLGVPSKQNAVFDGWTVYIDNQHYALSQVFTYTYQVNIDVYATWLFEVTYVTNNPLVSNYVITHRSRETYQFVDMSNKRVLGYQFDRWYLGTQSLSNTISQTSHHTVEARWLRVHLLATGSGTQQNPYRIEHVDQWRDLSDVVNGGNNLSGKYIELIINLDFNNQQISPVGNNQQADWFNNQINYQFMGTFDGKNYTLSNYLIDVSSNGDTFAGLFGYIGQSGVVKNLRVSNPVINGSSSLAYVAGENKGGTHHGAIAGINSGLIQNVKVTGGLIGGAALLDTHHGAVAGYIYQSTGRIISAIVETTTVTGTARRYASHGGIVGSLNNGYLQSVTFDGSVKSQFLASSAIPSSVIRYSFLGGIAGVSAGIIINAHITSATLSDTTTQTSVTPFEHYHGGIVGYMHDGSNQTSSTQNSKNNLVIELYNTRGYNILTTTYDVALIDVNSFNVVFLTPTRGTYFSGGLTGTIQHTHYSSGMRMAIAGYEMNLSHHTGTHFGNPLDYFSKTKLTTLEASIGPNHERLLRFSAIEEVVISDEETYRLSIPQLIFSVCLLINILYVTIKRRHPYV